jgi:hypothetical protein
MSAWHQVESCNAGTWTPTPPCRGANAPKRPYSVGSYGSGPYPPGTPPPWGQPADACGTGSWIKTPVPELETA